MPTTPDPGTLSGVFLFRGLDPQELERLASLLHERSFPAGASVMNADQPGEAVFVVLEGSVKVHLEQPDAAGVIPAVLGPGRAGGRDEHRRQPRALGQRDHARGERLAVG
jgi:CRP/FNR family transcriptional regulator, cyclic AMP receptor protein